MLDIPQAKVIEVKYLGPGKVKGSRVKMYDRVRQTSKTIGYDYKCNGPLEVALKHLRQDGAHIVSYGQLKDSYVINLIWGYEL